MTKLPISVKTSLLSYIDASGLTSMGVVVDLNGVSEKLREPKACFQDADFVVIEIETKVTHKNEINYNQVGSEAGLAAINCSAAVIAGLVTFGSAGAVPFSGGTSLALTSIGYAATVATGASCAVSVLRTYNALTTPEVNIALDNSPAYQTTMSVVDGISLLGVGASAFASVKIINILKRAGVSLKVAGKGSVKRQARARLAKESAKANRPGISNGELKSLIHAGEFPKRLSNIIISQNMVKSLKDSIAAGLSFLASALDGNIKSITISLVKLEA